jgi:hypothetical protein
MDKIQDCFSSLELLHQTIRLAYLFLTVRVLDFSHWRLNQLWWNESFNVYQTLENWAACWPFNYFIHLASILEKFLKKFLFIHFVKEVSRQIIYDSQNVLESNFVKRINYRSSIENLNMIWILKINQLVVLKIFRRFLSTVDQILFLSFSCFEWRSHQTSRVIQLMYFWKSHESDKNIELK